MLSENLLALRKRRHMTQEEVADRVGVSRQAVAKWESGESLPDIEKASALAKLFGVSLDELMDYTPGSTGIATPPPRGKYLFGVVTIGDKGQIVIPQKARKIFSLQPGDRLIVLGDDHQGLALIKENNLLDLLSAANAMGGEDQ